MNFLDKLKRKARYLLKFKAEPLATPDHRIEGFIKILDDGYGNINSFANKKSVDSKNEPIPWFTYPSIEFLNQLDLKESVILEWGIGNSTLYFAKRCKEILSIEHNQEWFNLITPQLPENAKDYLVEENEYSVFPLSLNRNFDIIIVDGIKRFECLKSAVKILKDGGMLIFDNADRNPEYCEFLRNQNLIEIDFHGFGPIVNFTTTTSIFLTRTVDFKPKTIQPLIPIGGGY
ncbi:hypothetical protein BH11BAC5_BH11BAC5_30010 [soil metagenome]